MGYMFVPLTWEERYIIRRCSDDEHDLKPMLRAGWREVLQGAGNRYFEVIEKFEKKLEKRFGGSKY